MKKITETEFIEKHFTGKTDDFRDIAMELRSSEINQIETTATNPSELRAALKAFRKAQERLYVFFENQWI